MQVIYDSRAAHARPRPRSHRTREAARPLLRDLTPSRRLPASALAWYLCCPFPLPFVMFGSRLFVLDEPQHATAPDGTAARIRDEPRTGRGLARPAEPDRDSDVPARDFSVEVEQREVDDDDTATRSSADSPAAGSHAPLVSVKATGSGGCQIDESRHGLTLSRRARLELERLNLHNWRAREWIPAVDAAGLRQGRRMYDLRHTFATRPSPPASRSTSSPASWARTSG